MPKLPVYTIQTSSTMSNVIRRFISYVGKVKLNDFKDSSHMALVDKYCSDEETRVSQLPTSS